MSKLQDIFGGEEYQVLQQAGQSSTFFGQQISEMSDADKTVVIGYLSRRSATLGPRVATLTGFHRQKAPLPKLTG